MNELVLEFFLLTVLYEFLHKMAEDINDTFTSFDATLQVVLTDMICHLYIMDGKCVIVEHTLDALFLTILNKYFS